MPVIPRTQRRVDVNATPLPQLSLDGLSAPGRAVQGLGKAIGGLAEEAMQEREKLDDFNFKIAATEFQNETERDLRESADNIDGDGRSYTADRLTNFDQRFNEFQQRFPNKKQEAQLFGLRQRGNVGERAYGTQQKHLQGYYTSQTQGVILNNIVPKIGEDLSSAIEAGQQASNIIDSVQGLSPQAKEALKVKSAAQIFDAWRAKANPIEAREDFEEFMTEFQQEQNRFSQDNPETRAKPAASPSTAIESRPARNDAIGRAATAGGVPDSWLRVFAQIESGGRANARTGSYKGLFQLSDSEFNKHGGGDIYNADDNAAAAAKKLKREAGEFQAKHGRAPTLTDLYLIHQQGEAGYGAHMRSPDAPAWQNMAGTGEGRQKGAKWAKQAIWGNIPSDMKARFPGGVESVTSADFVKVWEEKVARIAKRQGGVPDSEIVTPVSDAKPMGVGDYFRSMMMDKRNEIYNAAKSAEGEAEKHRREEFKKQNDTLEREAFDLLMDGKLDKGWLDRNEDRLDLDSYKRLSKAIRGDSGFTDSEIYTRLRERVDEEPEAVAKEAVDAFGRGQLNRGAFERIYTLSQSEMKADTKQPSFVKEARQHIQRVIRPELVSEEDSRKYMEVMNKYDAAIQGTPREKLTPESSTKMAESIIAAYKNDKLAGQRAKIDLPRFTRQSRATFSEESLTQALTETELAYQKKKLTEDEYKAQARLLKRWFEVIQAEKAPR